MEQLNGEESGIEWKYSKSRNIQREIAGAIDTITEEDYEKQVLSRMIRDIIQILQDNDYSDDQKGLKIQNRVSLHRNLKETTIKALEQLGEQKPDLLKSIKLAINNIK